MMARGQKMQQSLMSFVIQNFPIFFRGKLAFLAFHGDPVLFVDGLLLDRRLRQHFPLFEKH